MAIPDSFIPVEFPQQRANGQGKVEFVASAPVVTRIKVVGVNVKTDSPCDDNMHKAEITVTSSKLMSSELFMIGVNLVNLPAFEVDNVDTSGHATIRYNDCYDCVRPIDLGCERPMPPVTLMNEAGDEPRPVTGSLFQVTLKIDGYAPGAVVNAAVALCYGPPDG